MLKLLVLGILVSSAAFAADEENFAKRKEEMLANMSERIQKMEEMKTCVNSAADKEALKACHKGMKEWREGEKGERMEKHRGMLEKRKAKIDEKMKAMDEKK